MIYKFKCRLLVQKNNATNIYSLPVVSATTSWEMSFSVPTMDVEVLSQDGATDYIAPIRFDDIVRLQVSVQFNDNEKVVWQDLFGGRVLTPEVTFEAGKNTAKFNCVGHSDESRTKLLETVNNQSPYPYAAGKQITEIFTTILQVYGDRLCQDPSFQNDDPTPENLDTTDYEIKANQKYLKDFFQDLEKITGYTWFFRERPRYNKNGTLITPTIIDFLPIPGNPPLPDSGVYYENQFLSTWKVNVSGGTVSDIDINEVSTGETSGTFTLTAWDRITITYTGDIPPTWEWIPLNNKYKIIEGTPRLLSADFSAKGDTVYTRALEAGTVSSSTSTQFYWPSENITASGKYGVRTFSETDTGFTSDIMCANFAAGIVEKFAYPINVGEVVLQGTPEASIGDYVPVIIPSVDLNGQSLNNYFSVVKVQHDISAGKFNTTLGLGYVIDSPEKYLLRFAKMAHMAMNNFIS